MVGMNSNQLEADLSVEVCARKVIRESNYHRAYFDDITVQCENGILTLEGRLPSFYMKQVLQTILRDIDGLKAIENLTEVEAQDAVA